MTGDELKEWRKARSATQQELADALGVNVKTIKRAESGTDPISQMMEMALPAAEKLLERVLTFPVAVNVVTMARLDKFAAPFGLGGTVAIRYFIERLEPDPIVDGIGFAQWLEDIGVKHNRPDAIARILGAAEMTGD